jgi:hypothetical protein
MPRRAGASPVLGVGPGRSLRGSQNPNTRPRRGHTMPISPTGRSFRMSGVWFRSGSGFHRPGESPLESLSEFPRINLIGN